MKDDGSTAGRVVRVARMGLVASIAAVGLAYGGVLAAGASPGWAPAAVVVGNAGSVVSVMVLATSRGEDGVGRLAWPFAFVFVVLVLGFGAALAMPPAEGAGTGLWLGLPPRAAVVLYGVGLTTVLVVPAAYALTFDELALTDEDWRRVRDHAAQTDQRRAGRWIEGDGDASPDDEEAA